jgi:hypothetical protein
MTEQEWLECTEPEKMLEFLRGKVSNRKLRLFAVACCRHVWEWLPPYSRNAAETAEQYADKHASRASMARARKEVVKDHEAAGYWDGAMACGWFSAAWTVWDAATGAARCARSAVQPEAWIKAGVARRRTRKMQDAAKKACQQSKLIEAAAQAELLRDQFNPFRPRTADTLWLSSTIVALAAVLYLERAFDNVPILADALEDAGCTDAAILDHLRGPGPHVRGCWVVDLLLSKT